jgi:hypothetical protein
LVAIAWVLFVPTADWLATHDVGHVTGPLRMLRLQDARDAARGRLLTLGAGLFAVGALVYTARNFTLSREGQVTDRYTKAIEQLGSDKLDVRIGGVYALERIARDSARDHPAVMEVLTAFVREHSREQWPPHEADPDTPPRETRPDVQAAVTVVGRRNARDDRAPVRLSGANLTGADLDDADLTGHADLARVNLTGATLLNADLTAANLGYANLTDAYLGFADLTDAYLNQADLTDAILFHANLTGANLDGAKLTGASLDSANLTRANLTGARWPEDAPVPNGWIRGDPDSDWLMRANEERTDSPESEG